jgi:hypothetical protein
VVIVWITIEVVRHVYDLLQSFPRRLHCIRWFTCSCDLSGAKNNFPRRLHCIRWFKSQERTLREVNEVAIIKSINLNKQTSTEFECECNRFVNDVGRYLPVFSVTLPLSFSTWYSAIIKFPTIFSSSISEIIYTLYLKLSKIIRKI